MVKQFFQENIWNIGVLVVSICFAYFTIEANTARINQLEEKIVEIETNKVSKSTLTLKEQFLSSQLNTIETDIYHLNSRLDKKITIINELEERTNCISETTAVQEQRLKQNESELDGLWKFTNKFLEKL